MTPAAFKMPSAGVVLDGYKLQAEIASGSCGTVFQAENLISGERVALKIIPEQGSLADRELQAIRLYQSIEHPNLIRIHHVGKHDDMLFYTMDWCESSLAERKVSAEELAEIAGKLTGALAELHKHGLLHRDIKPDNILFRKGEAVLGDIGLLTLGENATYGGTPGFMPPDLATGKTGPNEYTDCYALAKSLYGALTGEKPGNFPSYSGPLSPAASLIMCAALAVCSEKPKIRTAAELLQFLNEPENASLPGKSKLRTLLTAAILILLTAAIGCFFYFKISEKKQGDNTETTKEIPPEEKRIQEKSLYESRKEAEERLLRKNRPVIHNGPFGLSVTRDDTL